MSYLASLAALAFAALVAYLWLTLPVDDEEASVRPVEQPERKPFYVADEDIPYGSPLVVEPYVGIEGRVLYREVRAAREHDRQVIGVAARDIGEGEVIEYDTWENTPDVLTRGGLSNNNYGLPVVYGRSPLLGAVQTQQDVNEWARLMLRCFGQGEVEEVGHGIYSHTFTFVPPLVCDEEEEARRSEEALQKAMDASARLRSYVERGYYGGLNFAPLVDDEEEDEGVTYETDFDYAMSLMPSGSHIRISGYELTPEKEDTTRVPGLLVDAEQWSRFNRDLDRILGEHADDITLTMEMFTATESKAVESDECLCDGCQN